MAIVSTPSSILKQAQNSLGALSSPSITTPANVTIQNISPELNSIAGSTALAQKAQIPYSNKQFIAPFNYQINVEGTMMNVDYLGKKIKTNTVLSHQ